MRVAVIGASIFVALSLAGCGRGTNPPDDGAARSAAVPTARDGQATSGPDQAAPAYGEPHRPQVHFSPPAHWMNDPNGLVYFDGEYHLFYQYYPDATVWGPMHWGHAVSRDLVHWQHLPIALAPDEKGYIFSGSAVIDWHNTSGFSDGTTPPMVAMFTYHDAERGKTGSNDHESQGIAYSNDRGRTWTKFAGNPALPNPGDRKDFRDPKVFWHAPSRRWVAAVSVTDHVRLYASPDLKSWQFLSDFGAGIGAHGGVWECPDLFPMRVEGSDEERWVLILNLNPGGPQGGSGTQYFVGDFDGTRFALDAAFAETLESQPAVWLDWGRDNYAGVTWSDVPGDDGRRLFLGWMGNWDYAQQVPTTPWRSAMTLPRALSLHRDPAGLRLHAGPVGELEALRVEPIRFDRRPVHDPLLIAEDAAGLLPREVVLEVSLQGEGDVGIELDNDLGQSYRIGFDRTSATFFSDRQRAGSHAFSPAFADRVHRAPRASNDPVLRMRLLFDTASVELFADDGSVAMTETFFPDRPFRRMRLFTQGDPVELLRGESWRWRSIWSGVGSTAEPAHPPE
ncbi:MAG: glycoside hydrolase family 32 protein [Xanthomonadales bacterium]|nr:glycoside hydrolase family 32 protein [Xanthomonadales bacterium]